MKTMKATVAREFHESLAMDEALLSAARQIEVKKSKRLAEEDKVRATDWTERPEEINGAIQRMHDGQTQGRVMLHRTTLA